MLVWILDTPVREADLAKIARWQNISILLCAKVCTIYVLFASEHTQYFIYKYVFMPVCGL